MLSTFWYYFDRFLPLLIGLGFILYSRFIQNRYLKLLCLIFGLGLAATVLLRLVLGLQ